MTDGHHRAVHARPAGLARLREAFDARLEATSFRTALAGCAAALILIVTAVTVALLLSGQGAAGGQGAADGAAAVPSDPAGAAGPAGTPAATPTDPSRPTTLPSASPATPAPAASSPAPSFPAAIPTASVPGSAPSATSSPSRCPPGQAKHHRC